MQRCIEAKIDMKWRCLFPIFKFINCRYKWKKMFVVRCYVFVALLKNTSWFTLNKKHKLNILCENPDGTRFKVVFIHKL